jgi:hypothetical protein
MTVGVFIGMVFLGAWVSGFALSVFWRIMKDSSQSTFMFFWGIINFCLWLIAITPYVVRFMAN